MSLKKKEPRDEGLHLDLLLFTNIKINKNVRALFCFLSLHSIFIICVKLQKKKGNIRISDQSFNNSYYYKHIYSFFFICYFGIINLNIHQ